MAAPPDLRNEDEEECPEMKANILSRLTFSWAKPLFLRASTLHKANKALEFDDLLHLASIDKGVTLAPLFEDSWKAQEEKLKLNASQPSVDDNDADSNADADTEKAQTPGPTVGRALRKVVGLPFLWAGVVKFFNTALQFLFPILLNAILKFIENAQAGRIPNEEDTPWHVTYRGYWLSALLFLAMGSKALSENYYFHQVYRASYQARVAVSVAVYNKALRLTSSERQATTLGELINLMQVDASKIEMFIPQFHTLWDGMFQIIGYMVILYNLIGWPCFAGLGVMIVAGPGQGIIMKRLFGLNRSMVKYTDDRVKTTNEAIQGIRCVKMYTWEESFQQMITNSRLDELDILKRMAYLNGFSRAYMGALPGLVAVVSFIVYSVGYDGKISASTLFAALIAYNQLRFPLLFYPMALATYAQASVSAKRVERFLGLSEVRTDEEGKKIYNSKDASLAKGEIKVKGATIYWSDPDKPVPVAEDNSNDMGSLGSSRHSVKSSSSKGSNGSKKSKSKSKKNSEVVVVDVVPDAEMQEEVKYPDPILTDVSMTIVPGELCAIIGRVGSGKTTLSSAILNEAVIAKDGGSIALNGKIAYAAQSSWILNATLRDNITFGSPYIKKKYDDIIRACQLTHDLSLLDAGDLTEIGENGINLSGGQRQRVSMARAAYSDADIVLFDDPLSALDPAVGKKVFDECIVKLMKGKTRVLITNGLQFLQYCDTVVALDQGKVSEQGTYQELSNSGGEVQNLLKELMTKNSSSSNTSEDAEDLPGRQRSDSHNSTGRDRAESAADDVDAAKDTEEIGDELITKEERNVGAVSWEVYKKYIIAGGGYPIFILAYFMFILCAGNELLSTIWVSLWTADSNYEKRSEFFYLGFYALTAVTLGLFVFLRALILARFGVRASATMHDDVLASVFNAPMSFFDTTPTGRILSRFSKDLYSIDLEISQNLDFFLYGSLTVVVSLGTICVVTPWFGVAILPLFFLYIKILNYFREVARETKRLESISRSPVFAHFSETLGGLGTIRAYDQAARFISDFERKVDANTRGTYNNRSADRWLSVRLELIGAVVGGLAAAFACSVVISNTIAGTGSANFASSAGLSLNYAISVTSLLNWVVRSFAQMEASMNSAERVLYYTENISQEAPSKSENLKPLMKSDGNSTTDDETLPPWSIAVKAMAGAETTPSGWPSSGTITLTNLEMRYRPETPLVIKGLNVKIDGGSRIGVVGRTGSGKSSLLLTLLRIVEPANVSEDEYQAPIIIDGIDILRIGLKDLRSKIGIIPQNPVLFSGTVRSNMDPFGEHTDGDIWDALDGCNMRSVIEELTALLDAPVSENGDNFSQGQRQLLCLGRALLKQCRILLLDEATSSVDYETDKVIQQTLRVAFAGCTVITIAHRVNTIMDSDKILVMSDGRAEEFGAPMDLLADKTSVFTEIVKQSEAE